MAFADLIPLRDVPQLLPGKPVTFRTVQSWYYTGLKGSKLKTVKIGGQVMTTKDYLMEFFQEIAKN